MGGPGRRVDLDLWVRATSENAARVWKALVAFGAPLDDLTLEDLESPEVAYQIGRVPQRIDILTSITGVVFDDAWKERVIVDVGGVHVPVLGRRHLVVNKRAVGRLRDLADVEELETSASDDDS